MSPCSSVRPASLILYGDDFCDEALAVLNDMPEINIVAILAQTERGAELARFHAIPCHSPVHLSALSNLCAHSSACPLICWLSPTAADRHSWVAPLLDQGVSILTALPPLGSQLTGWARHLRQSTGQLNFCTPLLAQPTVQRFLAMVALLHQREGTRGITIRCAMSQLWSVMAMLHEALAGIRRWQIVTVNTEHPQEVQVNLDIAGVAVSLVLLQRHVGDAELPSYFRHASQSGELTLTALGAIEWQALGELHPVCLTDEWHPQGREQQRAIGWQRVLLACYEGSLCPQPCLSQVQRYLTLGRLVEALMGALDTEKIQVPSTLSADRAALLAELSQLPVADVTPRRAFQANWQEAEQVGLARISSADTQSQLTAMAQALGQLEDLCLTQIKALICTACQGSSEAMSHQQIQDRVKPAKAHAWLLERWLLALEQQAWLSYSKGLWCWSAASEQDAQGDLAQLYSTLGFSSAMTELHQVTLQRLSDLIRGKVSIEEIIFAMDDPMASLSAYQSSAVSACLNAMSAHLLGQWLRAQGRRKLTVTEVGAGGGTFTRQHLPVLQDYLKHYHFTDKSPLFIDQARVSFAGQDSFSASVLDINQDFIAQGLLPAQTDVLLAGNVLHNAEHIGITLSYLRRVLRRGGLLLLTDSTQDNSAMLTSMQFLLSPSDANASPCPGGDGYRQQGEAFLSLPAWQEALADSGFRWLGCFPAEHHSLAMSGQRLMMATVA